MSRQTVIISGGMLEESYVLDVLNSEETDFIIAVDRGLAFLYQHHIRPDYIVGDFDSVSKDLVEYYRTKECVPIRAFNPVKDASDTEIAVRLAIALGRKNLVLLGGTGNRMDHVMANIQTLKIAKDAEVDMVLADSHNKIRLIKKEFILRKEEAWGKYFSVFPLGGEVGGFFIEGAKYPLTNHRLSPYDSLCVSNEIAGEEVRIHFPEGQIGRAHV